MSGWSSQSGPGSGAAGPGSGPGAEGPGHPGPGHPGAGFGGAGGPGGFGPAGYGPGGDPNDPTVVGGSPVAPNLRGRATVPSRAPAQPPTGPIMAPERPAPSLWRLPNRSELRTLKEGWEYTGFGAFIAFICWAIWAASNGRNLGTLFLAFVTVLAVAAGVFVLARLLGRLILEHQLGRVRRSATGAHLLTGMFLIAAGIAYLGNTTWIASFVTWLRDLITG